MCNVIYHLIIDSIIHNYPLQTRILFVSLIPLFFHGGISQSEVSRWLSLNEPSYNVVLLPTCDDARTSSPGDSEEILREMFQKHLPNFHASQKKLPNFHLKSKRLKYLKVMKYLINYLVHRCTPKFQVIFRYFQVICKQKCFRMFQTF